MDVVHGIDALRADHGRLFVVIGVFDGLHRGHRYLLEQLTSVATRHGARPTVITFDHHPDEILAGAAPPLLIDPAARLERLAAAGVAITIVQHFDADLRATSYDAFIERIRSRVDLAGFLMTPDAAFGFERRGTADAVAALGDRLGFAVEVVPPFTLDGRAVSSSAIRASIASGDLAVAEALLGRPVALRATVTGEDVEGSIGVAFPLPVAVPPDGEYACRIDGAAGLLRVRSGMLAVTPKPASGQVTIEILAREAASEAT